MKRGKAIITTSWDDGHPLDNKLCAILEQYGVKGTIYTPLTNWEREVMDKEKIKDLSKKFEIGCHTYNHKILTMISLDECNYEIKKSKQALEDLIGNKITSFCYPRGQYDNKIIDVVKKNGFKLGRTASILRISFSSSYECHPTIQAVNRISSSIMKNALLTSDTRFSMKMILSRLAFKKWDILAKKSLDYVLENGGVWHLWGHSWEIDRNKEWSNFESVIQYAAKQGKEYGAEFLTNSELVI